MDPYQQQRDQKLNNNQGRINETPSGTPSRTAAPDRQQQPQHHSGYTMITPNESRRNNLRMMAQREEEQLQRHREERRSAPVYIDPERVGGDGTFEEARERQFTGQRCSKMQKKLKREQEEKRRKEQEEMELQKMKDAQREKTERLDQKKREEHNRRRAQFQSDHTSRNDRFMQQFESKASAFGSAPSPIPDTQDVLSVKKNLEEIQQQHKRTNAAFLDKIERQMRASNMSRPSSSSSSESLDQEPSSHPQTIPEPHSGRAAGEDDPNTEPDFDWALMKLMTNFPHYDKDVLEDIVSQCNGDYQQAYGLLSP